MQLNDLSALVVHVRPYRESSAMVQFFTREQGRLTGVMKGLHRGRRQQLVQPFQLGSLSCRGGSGLLTVTSFDTSQRIRLDGDKLSAGFYVLELISRSLVERQIETGVFDATVRALVSLSEVDQTRGLAECLRRFESVLLSQLGYGLDFLHEGRSGVPIQAERFYRLIDEQGFVLADEVDGCDTIEPSLPQQQVKSQHHSNSALIPGYILLSIASGAIAEPSVGRILKNLNQQALLPLIGSAPLISRSMYLAKARG